MLRFATWKVVSILSVTVLALLVIAPSLLSPGARATLTNHLPSWFPVRTIVLGLDLQGGSHVLLEVDAASVLKTEVQNLRDDTRRLLREQKVPISGGVAMLPQGVQFHLLDPADAQKITPELTKLAQPIGGALLGGPVPPRVDVKQLDNGTIQLLVTDAAIHDKIRHAVDQSIEVLRRRVDALGTTEPNIQRQGDDRILVEVPGLQNPEKLKQILGTTAKLEFRLVAQPGEDANDYDMLDQTEEPGKLPVEKQVMVQGEDLTDAQPAFDQHTGEPVVEFRFNIRGGQRFGEVTSANVGRPFAIVLDGKVISAPRILGPITGGSGQISGRYTVEFGQQSRHPAAGRCAAGQAHDRRGAHGRPRPWPGFDRRRQACRLRRRRAGACLYAHHLRHVRHFRQYRADGAYRLHFRRPDPARRDADAARYRRHRPDDRHGGRTRTC